MAIRVVQRISKWGRGRILRKINFFLAISLTNVTRGGGELLSTLPPLYAYDVNLINIYVFVYRKLPNIYVFVYRKLLNINICVNRKRLNIYICVYRKLLNIYICVYRKLSD